MVKKKNKNGNIKKIINEKNENRLIREFPELIPNEGEKKVVFGKKKKKKIIFLRHFKTFLLNNRIGVWSWKVN